MLSILPSLLTVLVLVLLADAQSTGRTNCTSFEWDQQPAYLTYVPSSQRISAAVSCPERQNNSHFCPLSANGLLNPGFRYNLSAVLANSFWNTAGDSPTEVSFIHQLVYNSVRESLNGAEWDDSVVGSFNITRLLSPGSSGYLNMTILQRCFVGRIGDCTGPGIENGTVMEACSPVYHKLARGVNVLDSTVTVVNVSADMVSQFPDPFQNLSRSLEPNTAGAMQVPVGALFTAIPSCLFVMAATALLL